MRFSVTIVDDFLNRAFFKVGLFVGRHPGYFVIVPLLLACICITGYQRINYEIDPEYLFSPVNGPAKYERAVVEQHFRVNYSHDFDVTRITRAGRFGHVIVVSNDGNENMLRGEVWKELRLLDEIIRNATAVYNGESFTYEQVCARYKDECSSNNILNLDQIMDNFQGCGDWSIESNVSSDVQSSHLGLTHISTLLWRNNCQSGGLYHSVGALCPAGVLCGG
ncbi:patched domain-containing protein 3 isoform X4 [Diachasmimorpha longicaudata]|uniref:patched domain-containing protein 3 isoform X4 n=1 Tax=Diachasmimorpha longicaudata TaxID=58733 RepID=UPI0030B90194